jgi:hypothetical protein
MAKKSVEYRLVVVQDHAEEAEGELNRAAKDGFKIAGTTANAVILERKTKEKDEDEEEDDEDD